VARRDPAAIALPDGRILVVGGTDAGGAALTDAEIYDPRNERTVPLRGGLALARAFPVVAPLDGGRVLVTGGGNTTEIFETTDSSFSAGASFGFARDDHTLTRLTADLLIFGGAGVANPAELFFD
jgi:hypothetical protein